MTLTKDMTRPSSRYAREGTAAHKVAELVLGGDIFLPDKITVEGDEFIVSPGMCRALNPYVTHVESLRALPAAVTVLEKRLTVPGTDGMVWGTLDCGVRSGYDVHIVDLKFGRGVAVEPDGPQLKFYALAFASFMGMSLTRRRSKAHLTICQPRIEGPPVRTYDTTLMDLAGWLEAEVRPALERIATGDTSENVGAHCRWCARKTECAAFAARHQTHAAAVFDDRLTGG